MASIRRFIEELSSLSVENAFNPYSECCDCHDYSHAHNSRCKMLLEILESASNSEIDSLWIGRDLGYRGGRRTGLALTDDAHITAHTERWGVWAEKPTKSVVMAERTATVIWDVLRQIDDKIFLWNVFPLHPHEPDKPFTNRPHNSREQKIGEELLEQLIFILKPQNLVPIGRNAALVARRLHTNQKVFCMRHPSYGGQNVFLQQINELYKLHNGTLL